MSNLPENFMFSQSSLQDYVDCPRRFELKYILQQRYPALEIDDMLTFEQRMEQGQQFHQLVHQYLVGIPAEQLLSRIQDQEVKQWFEVYLADDLSRLSGSLYPEKTLTIPFDDYGLLAKIDLLSVGDCIQIIDWKTSRKLPRREILEKRLQTIVYRYVVAKGATYLNNGKTISPEQIEMVYWYADHAGKTLRFAYSKAQFEADEVYLLGLVKDIETRSRFPLTDNEHRCKFCTYRSICERGREAGSLDEWDAVDYDDASLDNFEIDIEQIAEIEF